MLRITAIAAVLAAAVLVAGCGSSAIPSGGVPTVTQIRTQTVTAPSGSPTTTAAIPTVTNTVTVVTETATDTVPTPTSETASAPTLSCDGSTGNELVELVAPGNCSILYPNLPLQGGVQLQDLHWTDWGMNTATATGISHGFHDGAPYDIQVKVWDLAPAGCGRSGDWYTHLSVKSAGYGWSKPYVTSYC